MADLGICTRDDCEHGIEANPALDVNVDVAGGWYVHDVSAEDAAIVCVEQHSNSTPELEEKLSAFIDEIKVRLGVGAAGEAAEEKRTQMAALRVDVVSYLAERAEVSNAAQEAGTAPSSADFQSWDDAALGLVDRLKDILGITEEEWA